MTEISAAALRGAVDLSSLRGRGQQPAGAPGTAAPAAGAPAPGETGAPAASGVVIDVTDASFGDIVELSRTVPVVVDLWAEWCGPCKQLSPVIEKVTKEQAGRVVLAKVDVDANPQIAQAFRAESIPMVIALIGGQPVPMFTGAVPEAQVREVFTKLLEVAEQSGVSGSVPFEDAPGDDASDAVEEVQEAPLPPLHAEAFEAIEAGDYERAAQAYERALAESPRDEEAKAGLGQVRLLGRVQGLDLQEVRAAAAAAPLDVDAQFQVADLDLAGGHIDDAFDRLLELFAALDAEQRVRVRERLVELFDLVGSADPRVAPARTRLASMLF
ncbi:Thioredoxin domain-containing protein EC-YbbN [Microbacterium esteraromaticum]|uniref:Thioredoxin domain-containing protein EC-YbbN n=1 Tax=Microbacterium esteraromaticum TaxID=57043 RepID=A0A1R4IDC1_9MICO|nr:tetratricopeptide repeat protein [Microbacterium esteraromaticum]SJN17808.1 Thioredoxin domain-containing protein EC-YbbN [Microbacterium esteraromaticum]